MKKGRSVSAYLNDARQAAHSDFAHADGQFNDAGSFNQNAFSNATGQSGMSKPTSQPYLVVVTSASAAAVSNFDILGSNEYLYGGAGTWGSDGSLTIGSVTISSGMPDVSYRYMLSQFLTNPQAIGLTYYNSATSNQIQQAFTINQKDANGNRSSRPIVPTIDPYQQQSTVLAINDAYMIDGNTKITISKILPNATVQFNFYPSDNVNLARGLEGSAVSKTFSDPGIVKAQKLVVS